MNYLEKQVDLFKEYRDLTVKNPYLVHAISADFALGAGIAFTFNYYFSMRSRLFGTYPGYLNKYIREEIKGDSLKVGDVFNLVTKTNCCDKPTYENLTKALLKLKEQVTKLEIKYLLMPKIGCGIDGLEWEKVSSIIKDIFEDVETNIIVCYLV